MSACSSMLSIVLLYHFCVLSVCDIVSKRMHILSKKFDHLVGPPYLTLPYLTIRGRRFTT